MHKKPKILSALQLIGHPRDAKRIDMLQQGGFEVEAIAFERDYQGGRLPNCSVQRLCKIKHGHYLRRVVNIVMSLPALRRAISRNHMVYASGQDMAITALIAGFGLGRPVALEVGDIVSLQVLPGIIGRIVRAVDRFFVNRLLLDNSGFGLSSWIYIMISG